VIGLLVIVGALILVLTALRDKTVAKWDTPEIQK